LKPTFPYDSEKLLFTILKQSGIITFAIICVSNEDGRLYDDLAFNDDIVDVSFAGRDEIAILIALNVFIGKWLFVKVFTEYWLLVLSGFTVTPFFGGETLFFLPAGFGGLACALRSGFSGALNKWRYLNIGHDKIFIRLGHRKAIAGNKNSVWIGARRKQSSKYRHCKNLMTLSFGSFESWEN
jgi:hypothetical protein